MLALEVKGKGRVTMVEVPEGDHKGLKVPIYVSDRREFAKAARDEAFFCSLRNAVALFRLGRST